MMRSTSGGTTDLQTMRAILHQAIDVYDFVLLFATLVHDGAVPNGHLEPFLSLEHQLCAAAGGQV